MFKNEKVIEYLQITLGVFLVAVGFYFFNQPANLITGGVTGLSLIIKSIFELAPIGVSIFIFAANLVLLVIGGLVLGKELFYKTIYGSLMLPFFTFLISLTKVSPAILYDQIAGDNKIIIVATLGAVLTGLGLGLVFKNNATTGGSDVVVRILHHKLRLPNSVSIYIADGLIVLLGLVYTKNIELTFFAILGIVISGYIVDKVLLTGRSGYTVFIVTNDYHLLKDLIYKKINRGVTKVHVTGGFSETEKDMIICTISKNQLYHLKAIIHENDPNAFTFITKTSESVGIGFSKWLG